MASLAAREVIVSTLAHIYAVADTRDYTGLRNAIQNDVDPATGRYVFALQCTSTIVVMARETGSWKWPALAFCYMLGLAWLASFATFQIARALLPA